MSGKGSKRRPGKGYLENWAAIFRARATESVDFDTETCPIDCPGCAADVAYDLAMEQAKEIVDAADEAWRKFINEEVENDD